VADVLVLCYHAVSDTWDDALAVTADDLERQVGRVLDRGYVPAGLTDAVLGLRPAPRTVALTFDDAYRSVFDEALPVLERLGVTATVFAVTSLVGRDTPMVWEEMESRAAGPHAAELVPMRWDDLADLADRGWEVGSHSRTHPHLTRLDDAALADELAASRADCEAALSRPCRAIAYPFGDVDARVVRAADRAGYAVGVGLGRTTAGPTRLVWPRVGVYRADTDARVRVKSLRALRARSGVRVTAALRGARTRVGTRRRGAPATG
jgi:peptidoglycan/xylan/chitin deacetylase (PgdA/CDA1 family)